MCTSLGGADDLELPSFPFLFFSTNVAIVLFLSSLFQGIAHPLARIPPEDRLEHWDSRFFSFLIGNDLGVSLVVEIERGN